MLNYSSFACLSDTYPLTTAALQQQAQTSSTFGRRTSALSPLNGSTAVASTPIVAAQQPQQPLPAGSPVVTAPSITAQRHQQQQQASPVTAKPSEGSASVNTSSVSSTGNNLGSRAASGSHTQAKNDSSGINTSSVSSTGKNLGSGAASSSHTLAKNVNGKANAADVGKESWTETKALVTESAVPSVFHIEGRCSIPSGPIPHKVAIAFLNLDAKMNYVVVPRTAAYAFLQVSIG